MSKRMKDPKGDLRFVHKSARLYGFRVLKLTAMGGQTGIRSRSLPAYSYLHQDTDFYSYSEPPGISKVMLECVIPFTPLKES